MKAHLTKVSLALLSAAFLLGCQEHGSEPVGPEGLGPEFAKVKNCNPVIGDVHPSCKPADDDDKTVTVTLSGGMEASDDDTLTGVKVFSDNDKKFAMNTTAQSRGTITMDFDAVVCVSEPIGANTDRVTRLQDQLTNPAIDVSMALFEVRVDRRNNENNVLDVTYDPDEKGQVILGWARRDPISVRITRDNADNEVFTFTGGRIRVGEVEGRARDRIRILCSGVTPGDPPAPAPVEAVTVTVIR